MARVQRELKSHSVGPCRVQNGHPVFRLFSNTFRRRNLLLLKKSQHFLIQKLHLWHSFLKFLYALMPCTFCVRRDVRPGASSWPSGVYGLLERWTISQNITVCTDTSFHTVAQMLEKLTKEAVSSSFEWPESFLTHPSGSLWDPTVILTSHDCLEYIFL